MPVSLHGPTHTRPTASSPATSPWCPIPVTVYETATAPDQGCRSGSAVGGAPAGGGVAWLARRSTRRGGRRPGQSRRLGPRRLVAGRLRKSARRGVRSARRLPGRRGGRGVARGEGRRRGVLDGVLVRIGELGLFLSVERRLHERQPGLHRPVATEEGFLRAVRIEVPFTADASPVEHRCGQLRRVGGPPGGQRVLAVLAAVALRVRRSVLEGDTTGRTGLAGHRAVKLLGVLAGALLDV